MKQTEDSVFSDRSRLFGFLGDPTKKQAISLSSLTLVPTSASFNRHTLMTAIDIEDKQVSKVLEYKRGDSWDKLTKDQIGMIKLMAYDSFRRSISEDVLSHDNFVEIEDHNSYKHPDEVTPDSLEYFENCSVTKCENIFMMMVSDDTDTYGNISYVDKDKIHILADISGEDIELEHFGLMLPEEYADKLHDIFFPHRDVDEEEEDE